jgi:hypothetical protein
VFIGWFSYPGGMAMGISSNLYRAAASSTPATAT